MLRYRIEQCYDESPRPWGIPLLMSRNHLAELLLECADQVAQGRAGRSAAMSPGVFTDGRGVARPTPPPPEDMTDVLPVMQQLPVNGTAARGAGLEDNLR